MLTMSPLTTEYVKVPVRAPGGADPTTSTVKMCMLVQGQAPSEEDWASADWETDTSGRAPVYLARLLVATPALGTYAAWVRVTAGAEDMVREAPGPVVVT